MAFRPFATFALLWALATLVHQLAFTFWTESWQGWVLVLAASAVLFRPDCTMRFLVLAVSSLLNLWNKLPFVPNHILFEGMLHVIMLLGAAAFFLRGTGRQEWRAVAGGWKKHLPLTIAAIAAKALFFAVPFLHEGILKPVLGSVTTILLLVALWRPLFRSPVVGGGEDFLKQFAPTVRLAVLIVYVWAVIQKLNWDYFDPEVSCAAKLHKEINAYFGNILPTANWALVGAAVGSLVFELFIPILIWFRRTRYVGFCAAVFFHLWLSIHPAAGIYSFTAEIFAFLALFLPVGWGERLQGLWDRQTTWLGGGKIETGRIRARWLALGVFFVALSIQATLYLTIARSFEVFHTANRVGFFAFFSWASWMGACYLISGWKARGRQGELPTRFQPTFVLIGLIPVLLNGIWPWLGGRTQTSFSMYSNLKSEGTGNHLFLRRIDLFENQNDLVEVLESSPDILSAGDRPRGIAHFAHIGHRLITWFEFRRLVSEFEGDFEVVYKRGQDELVLGRENGKVFGDTEAFEPIPLLKRKFVWFRRLEKLDGPMCCTH